MAKGFDSYIYKENAMVYLHPIAIHHLVQNGTPGT